ncbi:MAG: ComF family protein [Pseudobutyrivibrio sp.]|nr:ComF family protein [Pseudobutyrivibrio sp.]
MLFSIRSIINSCVGILYPKRCVSCEKVLLKIEKEAGICRACSKKIKIVGPISCMKCGSPIVDEAEEFCINCKKTSHYFDQNKAVFRYESPIKESMYRFKYSNRRCYAKTYARHAYKIYGSWIRENSIEAIIPVPMYTPKEKRRGYNQAAVFAKELGKLASLQVLEDLIQRDKETEAMKALNRLKRKKNLLNAFTLNKNVVQFRKVLIVDDIYTTGTTLNSVAKVLKHGGAAHVYGLCISIGEAK